MKVTAGTNQVDDARMKYNCSHGCCRVDSESGFCYICCQYTSESHDLDPEAMAKEG